MALDEIVAWWWHDDRPQGGQRLSWYGFADFVNTLNLGVPLVNSVGGDVHDMTKALNNHLFRHANGSNL